MKCKNCGGSGIDMFESECRFCGGMGVVEPLTEQEYIQTCNAEQLAYVLMKIFVTRTFCHLCPEGDVCDIGYNCEYSSGEKIEDWVKWLKEKHDDIR